MSCKYNNCKHCGYKSECEIFKENAELKSELEEKDNTVHTLDVLHKEAVKKYGDVNDQLAQAKEIIKKLMVFAETDLREYEEEYKEAEQFLKEEA
ncbi:MAG: hypothetical protein IKY09_02610 [Methanocorpusculum sp.]|nr:hypothetical protein [Methanocorpusculum sp.]